MFRFKIFLLTIAFTAALQGADISFVMLEQGFKPPEEEVKIWGFLYRAPTGAWVLSGDPNCKSCCLCAANKVKKQIILGSDFVGIETIRPVQISGKLMLDPKIDEQGVLRQYYVMHSPKMASNEGGNFIGWGVLLAIVVLLALIKIKFL